MGDKASKDLAPDVQIPKQKQKSIKKQKTPSKVKNSIVIASNDCEVDECKRMIIRMINRIKKNTNT
jgi:hypothetical protein